MLESLFLNARWRSRRESLDQCADRAWPFFRELAGLHELFGQWSKLGKTKREALANKLDNYVDAVAGFNGDTWGDTDIKPGDIIGRQLQVAVPRGAMSPAQQAAFDAATARAQNLGVNLVVTPIR